MLNSIQDAHCMNCKAEWTHEFMTSCMPKTFLSGEFKRHRENVLLEREKSMLVASMPYAEAEKERRVHQKAIADIEGEIKKYRQLIKKLQEDTYDHRVAIHATYKGEKKKEKREFIRACPSPGCKAFLSTQWKCGVCNVKVCSNCHEIKAPDVEHTCDPQNVETATAIMKETKPCPKCSVRIFKISGCDQIWCTNCHTAFSWQTGQIEVGRIHNPHYYEHLRQHGVVMPREIGDVACGGFPNVQIFVMHVNHIINGKAWTPRYNQRSDTHPIIQIFRGCLHIQEVEMPRFRIADNVDANMDLRVQYILGEITEENWKRTLQAREKKRTKMIDIRMILDTVITLHVDIMQRAMTATDKAVFDVLVTESNTIVDHINECFKIHSKKFSSSVVYTIDKETMMLATGGPIV
jgi:hypothetical protein